MTTEIKVPVLPESVADATVATWHVKAGDTVTRDQNLVDIETDKVVLEVVAPADGVIAEILHEEGATVLAEQVIANLTEGAAAAPKAEAGAATETPVASGKTEDIKVPVLPESVADATVATWHVKVGDPVSRDQNLVDIVTDKVVLEVVAPADGTLTSISADEGATVTAEEVIAQFAYGAAPVVAAPAEAPAADDSDTDALSPSVRRLLAEKGVDPGKVKGTGKGGRITKEDVEQFLKGGSTPVAAVPAEVAVNLGGDVQENVYNDALRRRLPIAFEAKNSTAMLRHLMKST